MFYILFITIFTVGIGIIDYYNFNYLLGNNMNSNFWSMYAIFVITLILIDYINIKKQKNKKEYSKMVIKNIYDSCNHAIDWFDEKEYVVNLYKDKCKKNPNIKIVECVLNTIFTDMNEFNQLSKEGIINKLELQKINELYKKFKELIELSIVFDKSYHEYSSKKKEIEDMIK